MWPWCLVVLSCCLIGCSRPALAEQTPGDMTARITDTANRITHFATWAVVTNTPVQSWDIPRGLSAEQDLLLADLRVFSSRPDLLRLLLKHQNPKVRTVALAALFIREDPQDLPFIAALMSDDAATVPDLHPSRRSGGGPPPMSEIETSLTVGAVARSMVNFYLVAAHAWSPPLSLGRFEVAPPATSGIIAAFDSYWTQRRDRVDCASWNLVRVMRATRRTEPVPARYRPDIDAAMAHIRSLPSPQREWTLLFVVHGASLPEPYQLASEGTLVAAVQNIGADALMTFLLLKPFSTDPDLDFVGLQSPSALGAPDPRGPRLEVFRRISNFILGHAAEVLRPDDAAALRENAATDVQHWHSATPLWMKAADALQPIPEPQAEADRIKSKVTRFPARGEFATQREQIDLAVALWHLRGKEEIGFLVDWFYDLPAHFPIFFLHAVDIERHPDTRLLLTAIVADPRLDTMNVSVMKELIGSASIGRARRLVDLREILSARSVPASWRAILRQHFGLTEPGSVVR